MTQTIPATEAKRNWSKLINKAFNREARFLVEKNGIPVAGIVSAEDVERLTELDEQRAKDMEALARIGEAFKDVPLEEVEREVARAVTEVREERRRKAEPRSE
jgi:prevent-host-death family protein